MALRAQSITADQISLTASNGKTVTFTGAQARKFATPALAQTAIRTLIQKQLGEHVGPRCVYVGIDENYNFTDLEQVNASGPANPPPPRRFAFDGAGNLIVTAFDGAQTTISVAAVKAAAQPLVFLKAQVAQALCDDPTGQYDLRATFDKSGAIASIGAATLADVENPLVSAQAPLTPQTEGK